jgi:hypothetical protein
MIETQIKDSLSEIQDFARNPLGLTRVINEIAVGHHVRQGDVYLQRISSFNKSDYEVTNERQLAEGNTKGASHTVDASVTVYKPVNKQNVKTQNNGFIMLGPVIESKDRFTLMHKQHAHFSMPAGTYQVSYQIDPQTMSRVLD